MSKSRIALAAFACAGLALVPNSAHAQGPAPSSTPAATADTATDHSLVVNRMGVGYFGQFGVGYGDLKTTAPTQLVGVRYWLSDGLGLDLALGIVSSSGSTKNGNTTTDNPSLFAVSFKGGVPLSLMSAKHYTFFIEPQLLFGYASQSIKPTGGDETKNTGTHFVLGAEAGAEIQFGFIGIPHLALDATVGLGLDLQSATTKTGNNPETSMSATSFGTASYNAPWNIFHSNVAARYYF